MFGRNKHTYSTGSRSVAPWLKQTFYRNKGRSPTEAISADERDIKGLEATSSIELFEGAGHDT